MPTGLRVFLASIRVTVYLDTTPTCWLVCWLPSWLPPPTEPGVAVLAAWLAAARLASAVSRPASTASSSSSEPANRVLRLGISLLCLESSFSIVVSERVVIY